MYGRKIKLLRALVGKEKISSAELMEKLQVSQRTLRSEISQVNDFLRKEKVAVHSFSAGGYYIKKEEKPVVHKILEGMICQSRQIIFPETPDERFLFGFAWLFFQKRPVSIQRAADKLYVSKTAMLQTKKRIQDTLRWYHELYLESGNQGMWISGREDVKRHVLAENINYRTYGSVMMERVITFLFGSEKYSQYILFARKLPDILTAHGCRLIDKGIEGFSLDVFISLMRKERGFLLDRIQDFRGTPCINEICSYWENQGYHIPEEEKSYWEQCLGTKRVFYPLKKGKMPGEMHMVLTRNFLALTDRKYGTRYEENQELVHKLSLHVMKMIKRMKQGYFETNSILEEILRRYEKEVEMADGINFLLQKEYGLTANIHEICYIAVYLKAYSSHPLKALVLCDLGEGIADNMIRQIRNYCGEKLQILDKMSLAEYRACPVMADLLISPSRIYNVELPEKTKIIYVDYLLNEENLKSIQDFLLKSEKGTGGVNHGTI